MSGKTRLLEFRDSHADLGLDVLRIFLGIALFVRGLLFVLGGSSRILELVAANGTDYFLPAILLQATTGLHLVGGLMLAAGLLTRIGALIQIPVLLGAVYLATLRGGLLVAGQSLELSVLVLFLLCVFFVHGSGRFSLDRYFFTHEEKPVRLGDPRPFTWEDRNASVPAAGAAPAADDRDGSASPRAYAAALAKYGVLSVSALALFVLGSRSLPASVSLTEIGAVGALVFVILGFFLLFYRSAFQED